MSTCRLCKKNLVGRIDKKFCNDQCRTAYHNLKRRKIRKIFISNMNQKIKKNNKILMELKMQYGSKKISTDLLEDKGFLFSYFSHEWCDSYNKTYRYCIDYGYVIEESGIYIIEMRKVNYYR